MTNTGKILVLTVGLTGLHQLLAGRFLVVKNYGVSFGYNGLFFILLNIIFILFFGWWSFKKGDWSILIFSGGLVNLMDRIILGYVRDYWNFLHSGLYNNVNDWIIGIGLICCLFDLLWKKSK